MTRIFVKTFGCSLNVADSMRIMGILEKAGFKIVKEEKDAELVIVNSCTVKTPTDNKVRRYIGDLRQMGKKVVLAGCVPQAQPDFEEVSMIGPGQIVNIVDVVEETLNDNIIKLLVQENLNKIALPKIRRNGVIEIVPICEGCLGHPCSYCLVKKARGELYSFPIEDIVKRIRHAVSYENKKEIWLTAQDTGCYGMDNDTNLIQLLREVEKIRGDFFVRIGMANPNHMLGIVDDIIDLMKGGRFFKFFHIPLQSGSDQVLKRMRRHYTSDDFRRLVGTIRKKIPVASIATDIISGFPGETNEQFRESVELIKEIKPDVLNMSKFWRRPGTEAYNMEQVPGEIIRDRSRLISEVFDWIQPEVNKRWIGRKCRVIVDERGKADTMVSRNESYKPVILKRGQIGDFLNVRITDSGMHDLFGEVI